MLLLTAGVLGAPAGARYDKNDPRWFDPRTLAQGGGRHPLPPDSGTGRRIVYSLSQQRVWLVANAGLVQRTYPVSGRQGIPRPSTYRVFSKSRHSRNGSVTMEYMVRFATGRRWNIGFHSIPVNSAGRPIQSEDELGSFRSSGCVRQHVRDAAFLWHWTPVGTTVVVTS